MTTPHPTPEERVEAALNDWRKDAGDLRVHFATAIREAEAAGEARGRAMERERCVKIARQCDIRFYEFNSSGKLQYQIDYARDDIVTAIRARTDKESSDD